MGEQQAELATSRTIKELEGNPGKRGLNKNEPKPGKRALSCPKWLDDDAKKEWRRLSKQMEQLGILTEIDMAAFAGYCQSYARWKAAEEFISKHGTIVKTPSGYWQQVPQVAFVKGQHLFHGLFDNEHITVQSPAIRRSC